MDIRIRRRQNGENKNYIHLSTPSFLPVTTQYTPLFHSNPLADNDKHSFRPQRCVCVFNIMHIK